MGLSSATTILSTGYRPLGSCSRAAGWSAATLCNGPGSADKGWAEPVHSAQYVRRQLVPLSPGRRRLRCRDIGLCSQSWDPQISSAPVDQGRLRASQRVRSEQPLLPIWLTTTMKYLSGSSARPFPMYTCSAILLVPDYQAGTRIAMSLAALSLPCAATAGLQP